MGLTQQQKQTYRSFWEKLADRADVRGGHPFSVSPKGRYYTGENVGIRKVDLNHVILKDRARGHLYIHNGGDDARERNKAIFGRLWDTRREIEADFGGELDWVTPETRGRDNAYGVQYWIVERGGLDHKDSWRELQRTMIEKMMRFEKALRPHIEKLRVSQS